MAYLAKITQKDNIMAITSSQITLTSQWQLVNTATAARDLIAYTRLQGVDVCEYSFTGASNTPPADGANNFNLTISTTNLAVAQGAYMWVRLKPNSYFIGTAILFIDIW